MIKTVAQTVMMIGLTAIKISTYKVISSSWWWLTKTSILFLVDTVDLDKDIEALLYAP